MSIGGIYQIVEMELWDKDVIDLVEPGYISIRGSKGKLHFICVDGQMDIRKSKERYLFTWDGTNESNSAGGYGNFTCSGDTLTGRIYIHDSADSSFVAVKVSQVNRVPRMINRGLLLVKAKEPFREWVSSLPATHEISIREINNDSIAYLIPQFEDDQQRDSIINKVYPDIFVAWLFNWCIDDNRWPQNRTLALFKNWFELECHSVVEDMVENDLRAESKSPPP
jgi:hypothetical protein